MVRTATTTHGTPGFAGTLALGRSTASLHRHLHRHLCEHKSRKANELTVLLNRYVKTFGQNYLQPLPDAPNSLLPAYRSTTVS